MDAPATRIALRPVDRETGRELERDEVVKGYEYERGQFVTFTPEELKALDVESSHMIDLATFVPRAEATATPHRRECDGLYVHKSGANVCFRVDPTIRWRGFEGRLRVGWRSNRGRSGGRFRRN